MAKLYTVYFRQKKTSYIKSQWISHSLPKSRFIWK